MILQLIYCCLSYAVSVTYGDPVTAPPVFSISNFLLVADSYPPEVYQFSLDTGKLIPLLADKKPSNPIAVAYDEIRKDVYFTDVGLGTINRFSLDTRIQTVLYTDASSVFDGMTLDSKRQRIYIADARSNGTVFEISMDGGNKRIISQETGSQPRGLVLDHVNRVLYWTDWSLSNPGIFSAPVENPDLKKQLISGNLMWPNALAIDFEEKVMYFGDGGLHKIEAADLDGHNRKVIVKEAYAHYFCFTPSSDVIYFTDWRDNQIRVLNLKTNDVSSHLETIDGFGRPNGIFYYRNASIPVSNIPWTKQTKKSTISPPPTTTTNNPRPSVTPISEVPKLFCKEEPDFDTMCGFIGISREECIERGCCYSNSTKHAVHCSHPVPIQDRFLLLADTFPPRLYQIDVDTGATLTISRGTPANPIAVAFDDVTNNVYWTDVGLGTINRMPLDTQLESVIYRNDSSVFDGIALDTDRQLIYVTDARQNGEVVEMAVDGSSKRIISKEAGSQPRAVIIDKDNRLLYWTDWSATNPGIFRIQVNDLSKKAQIVKENLKWPNALAIDFKAQLMYWGDAFLHTIEVSNLNGNDRTVIIQEAYARYFCMTPSPDYIYFTDWRDSSVRKLNRKTKIITTEITTTKFGRPNGIFYYEKSHETRTTTHLPVVPRKDRTLSITASLSFTLFIDGRVQTGLTHNATWDKADRVTVPSDTKVIAVMAMGDGKNGAILASTDDDFILTSSNWVCSNVYVNFWSSVDFDDKAWLNAIELKAGGKVVPGISPNAKRIWMTDKERVVYCRLRLSRSVLIDVRGNFEAYYDAYLVSTGESATLELPYNAGALSVQATSDHRDTTGLIASTEDGFILTSSKWKCSNTLYKDWTSAQFDDSFWSSATEVAYNGQDSSRFMYHHSYYAKWIWTNHFGSPWDSTVYCRLRLRKLFSITADASFRLYIDGRERLGLPNSADVKRVDTIAVPYDVKVIAVEAKGSKKFSGILASTDDGVILTSSSWKCFDKYVAGWTDIRFDDRSWTDATVVGDNSGKQVPDISDEAKWIWGKKPDGTIYCRTKLFSCKVFKCRPCNSGYLLTPEGCQDNCRCNDLCEHFVCPGKETCVLVPSIDKPTPALFPYCKSD